MEDAAAAARVAIFYEETTALLMPLQHAMHRDKPTSGRCHAVQWPHRCVEALGTRGKRSVS